MRLLGKKKAKNVLLDMKVGLVHTVGNGQEILNTGSRKSKIKLDN